MVLLDPWNIKQEILVMLRNSDSISVADRGVTTAVESFNGAPPLVIFDLVNTNLKNVRTITVNGAPMTFGEDYTVDYQGANVGRVTFAVAPGAGVNNVVITYDFGTDSIFPDWPRTDLTLASFPRIGFDISGGNSEVLGIGGDGLKTRWSVEVICYSNDMKELEDMGKTMRDYMFANRLNFFYINFLAPSYMGQMLPNVSMREEIYQRNFSFDIVCEVEL